MCQFHKKKGTSMTKEALKLALEYVELVPDDRYNAEHIDREALVTAIKEALMSVPDKAQPAVTESHKQKPVAWMNDMGTHIDLNVSGRGTPLYTSPPQRKPLTDEEIYDMYNEPRSDAEMIAFARAIEAAHGIKGEA